MCAHVCVCACTCVCIAPCAFVSLPLQKRAGLRPEPAAGNKIQPEFNNIVLVLFIFIITFNLEQVIQISIYGNDIVSF